MPPNVTRAQFKTSELEPETSWMGGGTGPKTSWILDGGRGGSKRIPPPNPGSHLQVVVVAAQVGGDSVPSQQRPQQPQQAVGGAVLSHRPNRVMTGYQHVTIVPRRDQTAPKPRELSFGCRGVCRTSGFGSDPEIIGGSAQQHRVQNQQPRRRVGARQAEAEAVVMVGEMPAGGGGEGIEDIGDTMGGDGGWPEDQDPPSKQ